ncbi:hypothetical protein HOR94_gp11 [Leclercia phage 10164-302]|uniref:Uncharacterized protein n=2 Tax=Teetrevirus tv10164302 TaxID=2732708 RepID=A0A289ZSW1_9CAUD|nr:hypothetical protein HOR94_gp11 [Leclercia phage 10164-302]ATA65254.1 hypothetical protein 10164302_00011 [Leclercia phage 10164-302]ATA65300.1 hypothetical protein 10164RH_00011 [Leclercia phage 10164RH]
MLQHHWNKPDLEARFPVNSAVRYSGDNPVLKGLTGTVQGHSHTGRVKVRFGIREAEVHPSVLIPLPKAGDSVGVKTPKEQPKEGTYTGGSADYYQVKVTNTTTEGRPEYIAECNDIIEALGMNFAEGNAFKALWRRAAQRTLGMRKAGAKDDGLYDAEKVEFFGARLVAQSKAVSK